MKAQYPRKRLSKSQTAWLAAIIEGEGHIGWNVNPRGHRVPVLQVGMNDPDVISRVAEMFGVPMRGPYGPYGKSNLPNYRAAIYGRGAIRILKLILPWLGNRRTARAREVLDWKYHRVSNNPKTGRLEVVA